MSHSASRVRLSVVAGGVMLLAVSRGAEAQDARPPAAVDHHAFGFVSGRAGFNFQGVPDGISGTSFGAGASLAAFISSQWAVEVEAWIPGQIEGSRVQNRVLLFSGSALKFFNDERRGPYMLFGLTSAQIQFDSSSDVAGSIQVGVGGTIRLSERTWFAPELRVNVVDGGALIFRPNAGLWYTF